MIGEANLKAGSEYTVFIGAKRYEALQAVDPTLGALIDYGWFSVLVDKDVVEVFLRPEGSAHGGR